MAGFATDQEISDRLDVLLKPADGETRPDYWSLLGGSQAIQDANAFAWGVVSSALAGRGYSPTQVLLWRDGKVAQIDLALWRLAVLGVIATDLDDKAIDRLDRRKDMLLGPIVDAAGVLIPVGDPVRPAVGHGACLSARERAGKGMMRDRSGNFRKF